ncbi:D-threo-aldose 1-dehydrogenase [Klebsormidium nitens]|uniref:D-threo-aldose 1-dehydrogenase n=1 Tax=Klebsormidium nitens TaxID=105231 RepID=A0A1Y1HS62_KLENI|nr:D-threo-aldose 1-dehydrogenase [Klebsormidium nitens]|eukprot:GAQ81474.1 D-threo-aldose 1-dehydrogenase [Klebsormidium nitens]
MAGTALPKRKLGKTGLEVSILGFGASPLGNVFGDLKEADGVEAVHEAIRLGINFIDVSPFYGATLAETNLGKALKDIPRDKFVLSTKVGRYGQDVFDFSAERVTKSVDESLARLNVEYIDIIQCHDIEYGSLDQIIEETLPALQKLKEAGKVRFIGITGLPLKIYKYVLDRVAPGTVDVVLSYCHYSLNDRSLGDLLPYLEEKGVGVINASPLSMGLLTEQGPPDWHPASDEIKGACKKAVEVAKSHGKNVTTLALQFATANPFIATTLVGMASPAIVRANVEAVVNGALDERLLNEVESVLSPLQNASWPSGKPENN